MDAPGVLGEIQRMAERHRLELLNGERAAASRMVRAYGSIWERLQRQLDKLLADQEAAIARGDLAEAERMVWMLQRMDTLQVQAAQEMSRFATFADETITAQQRQAAIMAAQHANEFAAGVGVEWNRLPVQAVTDLIGHTRDGSPLRTLLDKLGPQASEGIRKGLLEGVALGQNPRVVAQRIRGELGGDLARALRISRTESLRAYRESTRRNYQANEDIVIGWRWTAARQGRTCPACLAMDGTIHKLDEPLDGHPNCRCRPVPVLKGAEDFYDGWETGKDWLAKQDEATQKQVLGAAYPAYRDGKIGLGDLVQQHQSKEWGSYRTVRPLKDALGE